MSVWTKSLFNNKKRDWNLFAKNHRKEGTFTDNNGIMVLATAQYLGVILKIVPTSGDSRTPFYCIPDDVVDAETDGRPILWLGLHQDNTDRRYDGKAGHYQSLIPSVTSTSPPNPIPLSTTVDEPTATNIDSSVALAVTANDLFFNSLCTTLYSQVRPLYSINTIVGRKARRLVLALQKICLTDPRCPRELPAVSDCESPPPEQGAPDFMALFTGVNVGGGVGGGMVTGVRNRITSEDPTVSKSPPLHSTAIKPTSSKPRTIQRNFNLDR